MGKAAVEHFLNDLKRERLPAIPFGSAVRELPTIAELGAHMELSL